MSVCLLPLCEIKSLYHHSDPVHSYMKEGANLLPKHVLGLNEISIWHVESTKAGFPVLTVILFELPVLFLFRHTHKYPDRQVTIWSLYLRKASFQDLPTSRLSGDRSCIFYVALFPSFCLNNEHLRQNAVHRLWETTEHPISLELSLQVILEVPSSSLALGSSSFCPTVTIHFPVNSM